MERDWACKEEIRPQPAELAVWSLVSYEGTAKATLDLGIFSTVTEQTIHMTAYCPFWMINNTGLLLTYKVVTLLSNQSLSCSMKGQSKIPRSGLFARDGGLFFFSLSLSKYLFN